MHIKHHNLTPLPPPLNHRLKPNPILINLINSPSILPHNLTCLRLIASNKTLILPLPQPRRIHTSVTLVRIERSQVEGRKVEEYEVSGAEGVEVVERGEDAGGVIGEGFAGDLRGG